MKLTILFWNFNPSKGDRTRTPNDESKLALILADLVENQTVDVLVLADCSFSRQNILAALQAKDSRFDTPKFHHKKLWFFTRFSGEFLKAEEGDSRIAIYRLHMKGFKDLLLAAIHYLDRHNTTRDAQHNKIAPHRQTIVTAEKLAGHSRTVLFGDFNMNPFDIGLTDRTHGLGAMMTWELAWIYAGPEGNGSFYNPTWSIMGLSNAPGTYYWDKNDPENPFWHCLDGLLLRPALQNAFRTEDFRVIRHVSDESGNPLDLLRLAKRHWKTAYSDHLPIVFKLTLPPEIEHE